MHVKLGGRPRPHGGRRYPTEAAVAIGTVRYETVNFTRIIRHRSRFKTMLELFINPFCVSWTSDSDTKILGQPSTTPYITY